MLPQSWSPALCSHPSVLTMTRSTSLACPLDEFAQPSARVSSGLSDSDGKAFDILRRSA